MAQLEKPTYRDWVSQVLEDLEDLNIDMELEDIEMMKKEKFKSIVKEEIKKKTFQYLLEKKEERKSENAKGKLLKYTRFDMAEYLNPIDGEDFNIKERKWLFRCRVDDIEVKGNRRWFYQDISCTSCQKNVIETQFHLLFCEGLLGKNELVTYIPNYQDLYNGTPNEQIYTSRILKENIKIRDNIGLEDASQPM